MRSTLLRFEKDFFKKEKITDEQWLNTTLHDSFQEWEAPVFSFPKRRLSSLCCKPKLTGPSKFITLKQLPFPPSAGWYTILQKISKRTFLSDIHLG